VSGGDVLKFLQILTCNDIEKLKSGRMQYNALINESGGVVDDATVYCFDKKKYMLVVNAVNLEKDYEFIKKQNKNFNGDVLVENKSPEISQLALQGPKAETELIEYYKKINNNELASAVEILPYYSFIELDKNPVIISRSGYTGEDGFEIYLSKENAHIMWDGLVESKYIKPIGLGARDTLRLEAKYPLYGNELDDKWTIVESGQGWIVKDKQPSPKFQEHLLEQKKGINISKQIAGFVLLDEGIARKDCPIKDENHKVIGQVCSGSYSPLQKKSVGLAMIDKTYIQDEREIYIEIRNKNKKAKIHLAPFIESRAGKKRKNKG
jgi:aminomethyltransferase